MEKIKKRLLKTKTSSTLQINELSLDLEKKGQKVYKFGLGQSPFPVPESLVKELQKNADKKDYLNVSGLLELREAVASYHTIKNKNLYSAYDVIIGPGSKELIFQTQLIMDGDLLLPCPSWVSYEPQAQILNKKIQWLTCDAQNNWSLESEKLNKICSETPNVNKLLILNSPNNPSGTTHDDLKSLAQVASKHNVIIISDEIYAELDFSGEYKSISHFYPEGTIISNGLSKWCGAGGWRLGTFIFPKELDYIKNILRSIASETFTSVSTPIQYAAIKAFTENHDQYLIDSRRILSCIAEYIYTQLSEVGLRCQKPQGGFYMLCDFSEVISTSEKNLSSKLLCAKILKDIGFAMLPGSDFGIDEAKLITRIAFVDFDGKKAMALANGHSSLTKDFLNEACPNIVEGIDVLKHWIKSH